jgi:hypothetical protein
MAVHKNQKRRRMTFDHVLPTVLGLISHKSEAGIGTLTKVDSVLIYSLISIYVIRLHCCPW